MHMLNEKMIMTGSNVVSTWEVEGIRQRGRPKKTRWDCVKNDMESLGLSQKDAQSRNKWRSRIKIKGARVRKSLVLKTLVSAAD